MNCFVFCDVLLFKLTWKAYYRLFNGRFHCDNLPHSGSVCSMNCIVLSVSFFHNNSENIRHTHTFIQKLTFRNNPTQKTFTGVKSVTSPSLHKKDEGGYYGERNELSVFDAQHDFHGKSIMNGGNIPDTNPHTSALRWIFLPSLFLWRHMCRWGLTGINQTLIFEGLSCSSIEFSQIYRIKTISQNFRLALNIIRNPSKEHPLNCQRQDWPTLGCSHFCHSGLCRVLLGILLGNFVFVSDLLLK